MRVRFRLVNICVRHKYSNAQDGIRTSEKNQWKKTRTRDIKDSQVNDRIVTSKDGNSTNFIYNTPAIPHNFEAGFCDLFSRFDKTQRKPNSNIRVIRQFKNVDKDINFDTEQKNNTVNDENLKNAIRINEINMQMLPQSLHEQLFKDIGKQEQLSTEELNNIKKNLAIYGINVENATRLPDVNLKIPPLEGNNIEEHFYNIGKAQAKPYLKIINQIIENIPEVPKQWLFKEGWTRYTADGAESVNYPLEDGVVFDVEVCMKQGPLPTLATAVSNKAWYGWVSNSLVQGISQTFDTQFFTPAMLVPMESNKEEQGQRLNQHQKKSKIIVGHNVSYDRSRIKEQYWLNCTGTRFLDTMSLHVCVSGLNSYQRSILKSKKEKFDNDIWLSCTSLNSLVEVHKLYCGYDINKEPRNIFVEGTIEDIKDNFNTLMNYCASDVVATHNILRNLFPLFQERFPHPVTLAGMLELNSAYLPVNSNWQRYLEESDFTFDDLDYEAKFILAKRADSVCQLMHEEKYKDDLWMWDQDWSAQEIKMKKKVSSLKSKQTDVKITEENIKNKTDNKKYLSDDEEEEEDPLVKKFAYLEETKHLKPIRMPHMPGYPAWYRKLCLKPIEEDWVQGPQNISTSMQVVPKLLNLTWENYPLHYIRDHGWGILVPYNNNPNIDTKLPLKSLVAHCSLPTSNKYKDIFEYDMSTLNTAVQNDLHKTEFWRFKENKNESGNNMYKGTALWCNIDIDNCCYFFKLPHKDGAKYNVGNPLAKNFLSKFSENVLAGLNASAAEVLKIARMLSYWRNNRDRIISQMVIWLEDHCLPSSIKRVKARMRYGAIIPQVVVSGTLTRRAVEPTWMTASNAHLERIGSELRCMVQAPPGYNIVGADVDSQELWIASIIGDAYYKRIHGATPFGWMTLIGNKSNGTDMHSVTAKAIGISREQAKIVNYARIYGAGQKFAERLLKQFNPSMTDAEANSKSRKMFALTKGKKVFRLKPEFVNDDLKDKLCTSFEAYQLAKLHSKTLQDMFQKNEWVDGSESAMFNRLEEIAGSKHPVTPFLNARLSRALEGANVNNDDKFLPTKINWVVQSGAVDFLHLMLVSMKWLMKDNARFCLSFHDEIRYLVPTRYKYNAALAMHVTNLITRSFCASRLGMKDLPMSVAFFSSVEVDTVLRKESNHDCKTPSNPYGLQNGYEISPGESLDVWAALEKSCGSLGWWHEKDRKVKAVESSIEKSATA